MISKLPLNMIILDDEIKFNQNMNEMPKNLSLDKISCDKSITPAPQAEVDNNHINHLSKNVESKGNFENVDLKSNEFQSETRIQLSFSVDRLLSDKLQKDKKLANPKQNKEIQGNEKCCSELNSSYSCCSLPHCLVNSTSAALVCKGNAKQPSDEELASAPAFNFMDFKSVVRPTPVRAMGNRSDSVSPLMHFSSLPPTSLIRFHQTQIQHQKQLIQHLPAQQNLTSLSTLINPLCGLKPLQMSLQQMVGGQNFSATSPNRFSAKANFDINTVRTNLNCISSLRHHQLGISNTSDAQQFNHNNINSVTSSPPANLANANANTTNSHGSVSSGKRKRSWSRAVFSNLQRKGLEIQFQQQKYITKPDRRKLAARLNLTDAQVKVWFQNRRMKWRHTRENLKSGQEKPPGVSTTSDNLKSNVENVVGSNELPHGYSSDGSSSLEMSDIEHNDDDEIDVVE